MAHQQRLRPGVSPRAAAMRRSADGARFEVVTKTQHMHAAESMEREERAGAGDDRVGAAGERAFEGGTGRRRSAWRAPATRGRAGERVGRGRAGSRRSQAPARRWRSTPCRNGRCRCRGDRRSRGSCRVRLPARGPWRHEYRRRARRTCPLRAQRVRRMHADRAPRVRRERGYLPRARPCPRTHARRGAKQDLQGLCDLAARACRSTAAILIELWLRAWT